MFCFLTAGRVGRDDKWPGNLFQMLNATEENDFESTIEVFLKGTEMVMKAEKIVTECILGVFQQGKKAVGRATP